MISLLKKLPKPPINKINWPWTEETDPNIYNLKVEWPKISIVTPSFNQGQFIEETIRSILLQNYPNLEYIIIDGGSTDNTVEVIKKYEPWITFWVSEADKGQSDAINKGLKQSTGEIFNWINSDDCLLPQALFKVGKAFTDSKTQMFIAGSHLIDSERNVIRKNYGRPLQSTEALTIALNPINQPSTFFRTMFVKQSKISSNLHYNMDYELWVKFFCRYTLKEVCKEKTYIAEYRIHDESKTNLESDRTGIAFEKAFTSEKILIFKKLANALEEEKIEYVLDKLCVTGSDYDFILPDGCKKDILRLALYLYVYELSRKLLYAKRFAEGVLLSRIIEVENYPTYMQKDVLHVKRKLKINSFLPWV